MRLDTFTSTWYHSTRLPGYCSHDMEESMSKSGNSSSSEGRIESGSRGKVYAQSERVHGVLTARDAVVRPARAFDSTRILRIRERLDLSQALFARALNVSPETVRAWEQGKRVPDGAALRLLEIADDHPQLVMSAVSHIVDSRVKK